MKLDPRVLLLPIAALIASCSLRTSATHAPVASAKRADDARGATPKAEPARLESDVEWLADDAREGRRAGTQSALDCADWIAARLHELGLEPAGTQGFLQEFAVPLAPRTGGHSYVRVSRRAYDMVRTGEVEEGPDMAPLFCSEGGPVTSEAVFASFGIDDAERGRTDFEGLDLEGKIAIVVRGVPSTPPPMQPTADPAAPPSPHAPQNVEGDTSWGGDGLIFNKVMNAKRRGAVGVILVQNPRDAEPLLAFGQGGTARAGIPCATITWSSAGLFGEQDAWKARLEDTPSPPAPALFAPSRDHSRKVTIACDVHRDKGPARNVLGRLPGMDSSRCIVVGAHYDHLGRGGEGSLAPKELGQIHHGADDNASGVAAVLEIARILAAGPRPACDVVFALWSGEELGLLGSDWWAEHPTVPLASVTCDLNLDMVGRANNGKLQVLAAGTAAPFASWMKDAGGRAGLDLQVSTSGNTVGGSSDHATFLKRKIPALHLFSGLHADYHKPSDTADKFEAQGAAKVADLGVDLARRMCAAGRLAFVAPKVDPNEKPVRSAFRSWFGSIPNYVWDKKGVLIDGTSPGSPAEHAGFLKGDVLMQIGDIRLDSVNDFVFALNTYKPGDVVLVKFVRDGEDQETRVTLSTRGQQ